MSDKTPSPATASRDLWRKRGKTILIAAGGVGAFWLLSLPLPFLLGPMFACLAFALGGAKLANTAKLTLIFRTILGVAAGSAITPDVVGDIPRMLGSLALVPFFILSIALLSYPLLRRGFGFDPVTSYYSAMPGGLQDLVVFGEEAGAKVRVLALVHATRILLLVSLAPVAMQTFWDVDLTTPPGAPITGMDPLQTLLMVVCAIGGWQIAAKLKIFGASIIGPMILTAALTLTGVLHERPPAEMIMLSQFFIGLAVGSKYTGITAAELKKVVAAGLLNALLLTGISLGFMALISVLGLAHSLEAFMAFLPGGQGEMVVLAIIAGADLTYVVLHHILRLILVVTCAPLFGARLGMGASAAEDDIEKKSE